MYKAGASDFQFGGPRDVSFFCQSCTTYLEDFETQSNPRVDFVEEFPFLCQGMTGYKQQGLLHGEECTSLRDLAHMYTAGLAYPAIVFAAIANLSLSPSITKNSIIPSWADIVKCSAVLSLFYYM